MGRGEVAMSVDAGSISSQVRIDLAQLNADILSAKAAFDNLGAEWSRSADQYSNIAGKKYQSALQSIAEEMKNVQAVTDQGALTEAQGVERLIALRQQELQILQNRAVQEGSASEETVSAIQKTSDALGDLEAKEKILSSSGESGAGLFSTFEKMHDVMQGPVAAVKEVIATFAELKAKLDEMESEWAKAEKASTILGSVLQSTGANAWTTKGKLEALAGSLSELTGREKTEIVSMESVLLGFQNVKGDTFDRAAKSILNMSTVLGTDLTSAAKEVGKALNDPTSSLDALTRAGVKFDAQESAMIKTMAQTGDIAGAQNRILEAMDKHFGDSAQAVGELDSMLKTKLANSVKEVQEQIGRTTTTALAPMRRGFLGIVDSIKEAITKYNDWKEATKAEKAGTAGIDQYATLIDGLNVKIQQAYHSLETLSHYDWQGNLKSDALFKKQQDGIEANVDALVKLRDGYAAQKKAAEDAAAANAKAAADEAAKAKAQADAAAEQEEITKARTTVEDEYKEKLAEIDREVAAGMITEEEASKQKLEAQKSEIDGLVAVASQYKLTSGTTAQLIASETSSYVANRRALDDATAAKKDLLNETEGFNAQQKAERDAVDAEVKAFGEAQKKVEDLTLKYSDQTVVLTKNVEGIDAQEAALIASVEGMGASTVSTQAAITAIKSYYAALKDANAAHEAEKVQKELWSSVQSTALKVISSITAAYKSSISAQLSALEKQYDNEKELLEYDGKTKQQYLEDQVAAELAAGETTKAAATQKELDEYNLEVAYDKKKAELQYESDMASWKSTLLSITVESALAVAKALSSAAPPYNFVLAGLVGAATAAEYAAAFAAMPVLSAATGGIVLPSDGGSLVNVAENGSAELLLNNSAQGNAMLEAFAEKIAAKLGTGNQTIHLTVDGKTLASVVVRRINNGQVVVKS
jgi:hypothetical protein